MWTKCCRRVRCRKRLRVGMFLTCRVSNRWRWCTCPPRSRCVSLALGSLGASSDRTIGLRSIWRKPTGGKSSEKKYAHKLANVACWMLTTFIQAPPPPSLSGGRSIDSRASSSSCFHKLKEQHISRQFIIAPGMNFPKAASNFPCCYFQNPTRPFLSSPLLSSPPLPFVPSYFPFADHLFQQRETFKATAAATCTMLPLPRADQHSRRRFHVNILPSKHSLCL